MDFIRCNLLTQGVRGYDPGYVTFNGQKIPDAELGNRMPEFTIDDVRQEEV